MRLAENCTTSSSFGTNDGTMASRPARSCSTVNGPSRSDPPVTTSRCARVGPVPGCQLHGSIDSPPLNIQVKVTKPNTSPV